MPQSSFASNVHVGGVLQNKMHRSCLRGSNHDNNGVGDVGMQLLHTTGSHLIVIAHHLSGSVCYSLIAPLTCLLNCSFNLATSNYYLYVQTRQVVPQRPTWVWRACSNTWYFVDNCSKNGCILSRHITAIELCACLAICNILCGQTKLLNYASKQATVTTATIAKVIAQKLYLICTQSGEAGVRSKQCVVLVEKNQLNAANCTRTFGA